MSQPERSSATPAKEEESEDESEILEESPCGRWQKRREQVRQGNVQAIESTYLAMDTEEGVEVVWNEVNFTDRSVFRIHEENIKLVFDHFMQLEHPNIVKFHWYWIDSRETPTSDTSVSETPARETPARETPARETSAKETPTRETTARETTARETTARETTARETTARETTARETTARETTARETTARETTARETTARETSARETSARETSARETPARETPARETPARETPTRETPTREIPTRETPAQETPAQETPAQETPTRETTARKTSVRETPVRETPIRVIFITEYMSSGSLKQFLKKTKKNHKTMHEKVRIARQEGSFPVGEHFSSQGHSASDLQAWKRWCTQILSALSYLHSWETPLIHGTLTCDTIFIQHNGLIKIGSVWHRMFINALPKSPRSPLRSPREEQRNQHFFAPEYDEVLFATPGNQELKSMYKVSVGSLLFHQMAVLAIQRNADSSVSPEDIANASRSLHNPLMKEFIQKCLAPDPLQRPSAHDLLFHRVLFEVHSLKLLAAHSFIDNQHLMQENCVEEMTKRINPSAVKAEIRHMNRAGVQWTYSHVSALELDKFLEDVKNGIYPLMAFSSDRPHHLFWAETLIPQTTESVKSPTTEEHELETRKVIQMQCHLELHEDNTRWHLTLFLKLDDTLHRQLSCDLLPSEGSQELAQELVRYGFISQDDCQKLANFLEDTFSKHEGKGAASPSQHLGNGD
ncbi:nuclear receptor-binding protein 2-like [Heptranchias perlo]|uniref:nuclear receptor-binding protein 2-like n=1 Tax=Heptranchias perlo TaxID=212740 RepID=UPI00355A37EB